MGDLFTEEADFLLHDLPGLLGGPTGVQGIPHFVPLRGRQRIEFTDATVSLREGLLQLLEYAAMSSFAITQFHFQLMDAVLRRFQLLHADSELIPVGQPLIKLGNLVTEDADLFVEHFPGLLSRLTGLLRTAEVIHLDSGARIKCTNSLISR